MLSHGATVNCYTHSCTGRFDRGKLVTLIVGKRRRLFFAKDGRQSVYDKKPQRYTEDNRTEFNLIVRIVKSEAAVTNNKRLRSRYCIVEAN